MKLHTLLKATTTTTEQGTFTAVISAVSVDREGDRVDPDAMVKALRAWSATGKAIPLHWNHSGKPEDIIGGVDPESAKAVDGEVHVEGWFDLASSKAQEVWRLAKSGVLGFSFGYLVPEGGAKANQYGGKDILSLDVFEVTATTTPMNNDTRVTGWKGLKQLAGVTRDQLDALGREKFGGQNTYVYVDDFDPDAGFAVFGVMSENDASSSFQKVGYGAQEDGTLALADDPTEVTRGVTYRPKGMDSLRARADAVALEVATGGEEPAGQSQAEQQLNATETALKSVLAAMQEQNLRAAVFPPELPAELKTYLAGVIDAHEAAVKKAEEKSVDVTDPGDRVRSVDPLRAKADAVALAVAMGDTDLSNVKAPTPAPKPEPALPLSELKRRTREATLNVLTGGTES